MTNPQELIQLLSSKLGRPTPTTPPELTFKIPSLPQNTPEERIDLFLGTWQSLGGKGAVASNVEEIVNSLKQWFGEQPSWLSPHSILTWGKLPNLAQEALQKLEWPLRVYSSLPSNTTDRTAAAGKSELGITGADWGVALSGSVVLKSASDRGRAVSLVPPRHLTFVNASVLRDNNIQVFEELEAEGTPPAAIEFISGPSRTSDIEMDLSIGVHGPIEVYVIVLKDI